MEQRMFTDGKFYKSQYLQTYDVNNGIFQTFSISKVNVTYLYQGISLLYTDLNASYTHCNASNIHCNASYTHCNASYTHCNAGYTHCNVSYTHCNAMLLCFYLLILSFAKSLNSSRNEIFHNLAFQLFDKQHT